MNSRIGVELKVVWLNIVESSSNSEMKKVVSHTQREKDDWYINSIMIEGCDVPFKYMRRTPYKALKKGQLINLTYYIPTH